MKLAQTVEIVKHVVRERAKQRRIPLNRRTVSLLKLRGADFKVNRHEIRIDLDYATTGNPVVMVDRVLASVVEFDRRDQEERARQLVRIQTRVLRWTEYLQRTMSPVNYQQFLDRLSDPFVPIESLAPDPEPPAPGPDPKPDWIRPLDAPDASPFDMDAAALLAYGERMQDKGVYFRA